MSRWPSVPAVFGWLELDRRGRWLIKGEPVTNAALVAFIGRNYCADPEGRWFFQNGPQRVYVRLHYAPFVYRALPAAHGPAGLETHTGRAIALVLEALVDEAGSLLLRTETGVGVVSDRDLPLLAPLLRDVRGQPLDEQALDALLAGRGADGATFDWGSRRVPLQPVRSGELAKRFGFDPAPMPAPGEPDC